MSTKMNVIMDNDKMQLQSTFNVSTEEDHFYWQYGMIARKMTNFLKWMDDTCYFSYRSVTEWLWHCKSSIRNTDGRRPIFYTHTIIISHQWEGCPFQLYCSLAATLNGWRYKSFSYEKATSPKESLLPEIHSVSASDVLHHVVAIRISQFKALHQITIEKLMRNFTFICMQVVSKLPLF
jgi:hypothetical protein